MNFFNILPKEIYGEILMLLSYNSLRSMRITNKDIKKICTDNFYYNYICRNYNSLSYGYDKWSINISNDKNLTLTCLFRGEVFLWKNILKRLNYEKISIISVKSVHGTYLGSFNVIFKFNDNIKNIIKQIKKSMMNKFTTYCTSKGYKLDIPITFPYGPTNFIEITDKSLSILGYHKKLFDQSDPIGIICNERIYLFDYINCYGNLNIY